VAGSSPARVALIVIFLREVIMHNVGDVYADHRGWLWRVVSAARDHSGYEVEHADTFAERFATLYPQG
jgi:hypothetical protein